MDSMKIYDEITLEELDSPDMNKGYIYPSKRLVASHPAQEKVFHMEVMPGTEDMNDGKGLCTIVVDQEASEAWDEYEECFLYHEYSEQEIADMAEQFSGGDSVQTITENTIWDDLANAFNEGVNS